MYGDRTELLDARKDFARDFLTQRANVGREAKAGNGAGGRVSTPEIVESNLLAKTATQKLPGSIVEGQMPVTVADWEIALADENPSREPAELAVKMGYIILIGPDRFRVKSTDAGRTDALCLRVEAVKLQ